jgi:ClpX C4-type zinc finger
MSEPGINPSVTTRFKAAARLLFRRGDDGIVCSFCGRSRWKTGKIVAGPGVAICEDCAMIAATVGYANSLGPVPEGKCLVSVPSMLNQAEKLAKEQFRDLEEIISKAATNHNATVVTFLFRLSAPEAADYLSLDVLCEEGTDVPAIQKSITAEIRSALGLPEHWTADQAG